MFAVAARCKVPSVRVARPRHRALSLQAEPEVIDKGSRSTKDAKRGFRWDPAMSRWVQNEKWDGYDAPAEIQPKSGPAYTMWPVMHSDLVEYGLTSYEVPEAAEMQKNGWTLLDVRLEDAFAASHIEGSVNVPLYGPVLGDNMYDKIKRVAMSAFFMKATERDVNFAANVVDKLGKDAKIMLVCDRGGTLCTKIRTPHKKKAYEVKDPDYAFGREARSLKAAHALLVIGCKNLAHLEGGMQQWRYDGFPMESS